MGKGRFQTIHEMKKCVLTFKDQSPLILKRFYRLCEGLSLSVTYSPRDEAQPNCDMVSILRSLEVIIWANSEVDLGLSSSPHRKYTNCSAKGNHELW